jgi:hypothetical protein
VADDPLENDLRSGAAIALAKPGYRILASLRIDCLMPELMPEASSTQELTASASPVQFLSGRLIGLNPRFDLLPERTSVLSRQTAGHKKRPVFYFKTVLRVSVG